MQEVKNNIAEKLAEASFENLIEYKIPRFGLNDYAQEAIIKRRNWLENNTNTNLNHTKQYSFEPLDIKANIENFIGVSQVPVGITGPIKVNGQEAKGMFYVPFATTEGTLVATYQRGMMAITKAGGAKVVVVKNKLDITPIFECQDIYEAKLFADWVDDHFEEIKTAAEQTTKHGILKKIAIYHLGSNVLLNFQYYTQDAMGLNMVNVATQNACLYIKDQVKNIRFYLRCNLSSDKKVSFFNFINSYGKEVLAEVIIPEKIVKRYLSTTAEEIYRFHQLVVLGGIQGGMIGNNCHFANGLAAIFIACGQDVAQIVNASIGITILNLTQQGDLYVTLKLPNLIIGTVGGGTRLKTQREALEIMQCYGENKAIKFSEIVAATLLGGEISILAALTSDAFVNAHIKKRNGVVS